MTSPPLFYTYHSVKKSRLIEEYFFLQGLPLTCPLEAPLLGNHSYHSVGNNFCHFSVNFVTFCLCPPLLVLFVEILFLR